MSSYSKTPVLHEMPGQKTTEPSREASLAKVAALKLKRDQDASQAMKDHETARQETLTKTARLKAARLARAANEAPSQKAKRPGT